MIRKPHIGRIDFATKEAKAAFMTRESIHDATLTEVQRWAAVFRPLPHRERAIAILRFVQSLEYVRDPGAEYLEDAEVSLLRGWGDCDAKERVFVALCTACGLPAVADPVFRGDQFPHVAAMVGLPERAPAGGWALRWYKTDPTIQNSTVGWIPPYRYAQTNHWR